MPFFNSDDDTKENFEKKIRRSFIVNNGSTPHTPLVFGSIYD